MKKNFNFIVIFALALVCVILWGTTWTARQDYMKLYEADTARTSQSIFRESNPIIRNVEGVASFSTAVFYIDCGLLHRNDTLFVVPVIQK